MSMPSDDHMSKAADASARRIEVFTGAGRRRAWTAAEKAAIVAESYAGAVSVCDVARRHGLTPRRSQSHTEQAVRSVARYMLRADEFGWIVSLFESRGLVLVSATEGGPAQPVCISESWIGGGGYISGQQSILFGLGRRW
jgi:Transposase